MFTSSAVFMFSVTPQKTTNKQTNKQTKKKNNKKRNKTKNVYDSDKREEETFNKMKTDK